MDLEIHHLEPFARGGSHEAANLALRCRAHNLYQAKADYGASRIEGLIEGKRRLSGVINEPGLAPP